MHGVQKLFEGLCTPTGKTLTNSDVTVFEFDYDPSQDCALFLPGFLSGSCDFSSLALRSFGPLFFFLSEVLCLALRFFVFLILWYGCAVVWFIGSLVLFCSLMCPPIRGQRLAELRFSSLADPGQTRGTPLRKCRLKMGSMGAMG